MLKFTPRYADSFKKRMECPSFPSTYERRVLSHSTVSIFGEGPTTFGLSKSAVAGEEPFQGLVELKLSGFEADGLQKPGSG